MKANTTEHKQYLINSISEMELFIDKIIGSIYAQRDTISEKSLRVFYGIIDRKRENIQRFKQLLATQYNHTIKLKQTRSPLYPSNCNI